MSSNERAVCASLVANVFVIESSISASFVRASSSNLSFSFLSSNTEAEDVFAVILWLSSSMVSWLLRNAASVAALFAAARSTARTDSKRPVASVTACCPAARSADRRASIRCSI